MLINGDPLASVPLNGPSARSAVEPVVITPPMLPDPGVPASGFAYRWSVSLTLDNVQIADWLTGRISIDREESAAGVATFSLFYPAGTAVPVELVGGEVAIDLVSETGGETTINRRYRGLVREPVWDAVTRVMTVTCGDNLQQRVEALDIPTIDSLCGGEWTSDVFEKVDGRSRWDYANERLESRTASLDMSTEGELRVTGWFANEAAFVFGAGSTCYQSIGVELSLVGNATNRVELEVGYRYSRLWQRNQSYGWQHPGTAGFAGMQGFCVWRIDSTELPDSEMIRSATESAGMTMSFNTLTRLPLTSADPCGTGMPWINNNADLLLGATWIGGQRWTQYITERYTIVLATEAGTVDTKQVIRRESTALEIESERAEKWESDEGLSSSGVEDLKDQARRDAVLMSMMRRAYKTIIDSHRGTTVSWQVPTPRAFGVDLVHTVELNDGTQARGKVRRILDEFDLDTGLALTTISVALMRGGGESDLISPPPAPEVDIPKNTGAGSPPMRTQLGGRRGVSYHEEWDGFSGNHSYPVSGSEQFPRSFAITAPEISEEVRDEREVPIAGFYRVGVPNDLLVL